MVLRIVVWQYRDLCSPLLQDKCMQDTHRYTLKFVIGLEMLNGPSCECVRLSC